MAALFRPAREEDLPRLSALEAEAFRDPWSENLLREEYLAARDPAAWPRLFVSEADGAIVAYSASFLLLDEIQLYRIAVSPASRRRGEGLGHLESLLALARTSGALLCTLEVRETNLPARSFYTKAGFIEVGRRKAYYADTKEAAVLMDLSL